MTKRDHFQPRPGERGAAWVAVAVAYRELTVLGVSEVLPTMHGSDRLTRDDALEMKRLCLLTIEALSKDLLVARRALPSTEFEQRRRLIGSMIATIQGNLLDPVTTVYPDLDDLADDGEQGHGHRP
jgi:hypothetical protein